MAEILDLLELEPNIPSRDFGTYCTHLSAPPKWGKSDWCTRFEKPLIYDFEEGSKGKVTYRVPISSWSEVKKYNKQLTKNPDLKAKYKTICFDTTNYALEYAKSYIMNDYQSKHPDTLIDTFNKIPYGGGHELLSKEFKGEINKLKKAGYGVVFVSHVKDKTFDKDSEQEHTKTVPDLSDRERNMISAMADFLLLGEFELEVVEPAIKDDKGKVIKEAIVNTNRVLFLRTNQGAEAGFRWEDCPEKIAFDFDLFKQVFEEAVDKEIAKGKTKFGISDAKAEEIREKIEERVQEEEEEVFAESKLEDLIAEVVSLIKKARDKKIDTKKIVEALGEVRDPKTITDAEVAKNIIHNLETLLLY